MKASYYVYMLQCSDGSFYTGYTTDVLRRVKEHNAGQASRITRAKLPAVLIHKESFDTRSAAMKREAEIKSLTRAEKEKLIETHGDIDGSNWRH